MVQSARRQRALALYDTVSDTEIEYVLHELEKQFRLVSTPLPDGWNTRKRFDKVLLQLDKQSSPGWPLMREAPTIGRWLFADGPFPIPRKADTLWAMVQDVFSGNYNHIFKTFIKMEPHTKKKALEGRWRLIMMCSLPNQVAWHMAVGHLEDRFLDMYRCPLAHSLIYFGGGWKRFRRFYQQHNLSWCADKSGWDWNSPGWVYVVCRELRKRLTIGATKEWERVIDILYDDAYFTSVLMLVDGTLVRQEKPGLMKSGLVVTIGDNGIAQLALHIRAERRIGVRTKTMIIATGDDTFQQPPEDEKAYISALTSSGCIVKEYGRGTDFMGFEILSTGFYPKYFAKHVATLRYQKDEYLQETLESYLRIYAYDDLRSGFFRSCGEKLGFTFPSKQYFRYFAENPDALESYSGLARPSFGDRDGGGGVAY